MSTFRHWTPGSNISFSASTGTDAIEIDGYWGTWYTIDAFMFRRNKFFILESEDFGDETAHLVIDKTGKVFLNDVYDEDFDELKERLKNYWNDYVETSLVKR